MASARDSLGGTGDNAEGFRALGVEQHSSGRSLAPDAEAGASSSSSSSSSSSAAAASAAAAAAAAAHPSSCSSSAPYAITRQFQDSLFACLTREQQEFASAADTLVMQAGDFVWGEMGREGGARIKSLAETAVADHLMEYLMANRSPHLQPYSVDREVQGKFGGQRADLVITCAALQLKLLYELKRTPAGDPGWKGDAFSGLCDSPGTSASSLVNALEQLNGTSAQLAELPSIHGQFLVRAQALYNFPRHRSSKPQFFARARDIHDLYTRWESAAAAEKELDALKAKQSADAADVQSLKKKLAAAETQLAESDLKVKLVEDRGVSGMRKRLAEELKSCKMLSHATAAASGGGSSSSSSSSSSARGGHSSLQQGMEDKEEEEEGAGARGQRSGAASKGSGKRPRAAGEEEEEAQEVILVPDGDGSAAAAPETKIGGGGTSRYNCRNCERKGHNVTTCGKACMKCLPDGAIHKPAACIRKCSRHECKQVGWHSRCTAMSGK